ncbi:TetR/AcrR family transcriptional regulator [Undibacterium sp.]|uniref:TetR/AcrR family transcriptional regulator n=1 Tax=Undibacterium sp. TaxID=1914977 RepID=UPI00374CDC78
MLKNTRSKPRREESLTRDSIIEASIALLDSSGESGLTFRALADRLATGAGAIYWHINNKNDLLIAACDAVVVRTLDVHDAATPKAAIRKLALGMFDMMDAHPWVGSALIQAAAQLPMVRILERVGQQIRALGVPDDAQWIAASSLLHYILGVGGQNAANTQFARAHDLDRSRFLGDISAAWLELDAEEFPFTRSMAAQLRAHDDREDFLAGVDLILSGIAQPGS